MKETGCCGNPCQSCFFDRCPGCKSADPFCSYATLFSDRKCPNAVCCEEKGLAGCWDCPLLPGCAKGFYGGGEKDAKAYALFIRAHGEAALYGALSRLDTPKGAHPLKALKALDDTQAVLARLEQLL